MAKKIFLSLIILICLLGCQNISLGMKKLNVYEYFTNPQAIELAVASANGNISKINELIDKGTPVDIQGRGGITPLWWVLLNRGRNGYAAMEALLKRGANPDARVTQMNSTMLDIFASGTVPELIELFVKHGADMYWVDKEHGRNFPPIADSFGLKNFENVKMFYKLGFDMNYKNHCDVPLIYDAVASSAYDIVIWMIEDLEVKTDVYSKAGQNVAHLVQEQYKRKHGKEKKKLAYILKLLKERGIKFPAISPTQYRKMHNIKEVCL